MTTFNRKKVGYFYWGFLGDKKFNAEGKEVSTPDGNAFYSWSIIKALQDAGKDVVLFSDRDKVGFKKLGMDLFKSFATKERTLAYCNTLSADIGDPYMDMEYAIVEWRWDIPGRNDEATKKDHPEIYQPDREIMKDVIANCNERNIPVVVFDLDYKLTEDDVRELGIKYVIELGRKWQSSDLLSAAQVQIPFDFTVMDEIPIKSKGFDADVVYIGNRYERDWCIDKYLPEGTVVHGNWLEPGHGDPQNEWPHIDFRKRVNASEIKEPYNNAVCTVLLAKKEYCAMGFMTARIQEAVFYGTVPLFIEEYGKDVIDTYAGKFADNLTVRSKDDVKDMVEIFKTMPNIIRKQIIEYLRKHLRFMDSKFFVADVEALLK